MDLEDAMLARLHDALDRLLKRDPAWKELPRDPEEPHTPESWEETHCVEDVLQWESPEAELSQWTIERSGSNYLVSWYCSVRRHLDEKSRKAERVAFSHYDAVRHRKGRLDRRFRDVAKEMAQAVRDEVLLMATRLRDAGLSEDDISGLFAASLARGVHEP